MSDGGGTNRTMVRSGPYSYRPPSPPRIHIPVRKAEDIFMWPSYNLVDSSKLTLEEFNIITGNRMQKSTDRSVRWRYEMRRESQLILDYLFLGPTSTIRDHDFLKREAITMLVVVRDSRAPMNLASVNTASETFNIAYCYVDVDTNHLVPAFNQIVNVINSHLLTEHNNTGGATHGKVLVTCTTGNMLSPTLVAAYVMFMFGQEMLEAINFVSVQRFCANFDDEAKGALLTWQELNKASVAVARRCRLERDSEENGHAPALAYAEGTPNTKRGLDDMMDGVEEDLESNGDHDRGGYAPFLDVDQ
ncbi:Serine/threonine/tyrosine-interacting protein [Trichoderma lentiforme]|uniref:Serine/threonine/tyrosine-interacting protein n=1 Tax=Trichoderma lentiforme TaxID=1567552 RepID=A0A9P4X491_9HYPO|nr:Serine/threonine/tyrosine-interacting protein [Trichoderma lentiforme]